MIGLDDPLWAELCHSYGSGQDIPDRIRHIEQTEKPTAEFWEELGNILCHQCTVGTASVAAFPHLVRIAEQNAANHKGFEALKLAGEILAYTIGPENEIPQIDVSSGTSPLWRQARTKEPKDEAREIDDTLVRPFRKAIEDGQHLVSSMFFEKKRTFQDCMELLAIAAAFGYRAEIFLLLSGMRAGWFWCPVCEECVETESMYTF